MQGHRHREHLNHNQRTTSTSPLDFVRPGSAVAFYASSFFHPLFVEVSVMWTRRTLRNGCAGAGPKGGAA